MDARAWDERYAGSALVWSAGPNQFVESELAGLPPGRAVDLAAGEGRNALWLAEHGWSVTAVDFSGVALDKGREIAGHRAPRQGRSLDVTWVCADVTAWTAGERYDLAVVAYLQLEAEQRRAALTRAFAALRTGGTLFVVGHDSTNLTEGVGGPQDPDVLFTAEEVLGDLDGERFEVLRAERVGRQVDVVDGPGGTAWDALVRLTRTD